MHTTDSNRYKEGDTISLTVTFSELIRTKGTLLVNWTGTNVKTGSRVDVSKVFTCNTSSSLVNTLTCTYTVTSNDSISDVALTGTLNYTYYVEDIAGGILSASYTTDATGVATNSTKETVYNLYVSGVNTNDRLYLVLDTTNPTVTIPYGEKIYY